MIVSKHRTEVLKTLLICALLAGGTLLAFWRVNYAGFVNLDDPAYVTENLRVQRGLTGENVRWAFSTFYFSNWHPLTWLSYMLDWQLFGNNARAMHLINLAFHALNGVLLFLVLKRMTGAFWASGVVAALFAVHPLHVESVAWIAERKDVLSTFFWILTMWAYVEYTRRRCAGYYTAALAFFALGLMSKPMLVTLPFVLLLLDFWPLGRLKLGGAEAIGLDGARPSAGRLVFEKLPFFVFAGVSSYLTFVAQRHGEAVVSFVRLPFTRRLENVIVSYGRYLEKTFWPTDLVVFYPHTINWTPAQLTCYFLLFIGLSTLAVVVARRSPWFFVGWWWFVGTLVPVIGLVQVGSQSMADRYTYVPHIGLFIGLVWTAREWVIGKRLGPFAVAGAAAAIVGLGVVTYRQTGYWKDSTTLLTRAQGLTRANPLILNNLGNELFYEGKLEEALAKFKAALEIVPNDDLTLENIGAVYLRQGKVDQAIEQYRAALQCAPKKAGVNFNLGLALATKRDYQEALKHYRRALEADPLHVTAHLSAGNAYAALGDTEAAITNYLATVAIKPDFAQAHYNIGNARLSQGRLDEAIKYLSNAVRIDDGYARAHSQMGTALQQSGKNAEAMKHFERAIALDPGDVSARAQLAGLFAATGQTEAAINQSREALKVTPDAVLILNNLAWMLATTPEAKLRNGAEAVRLAERAVELSQRKEVFFLGTLAAAYAEAGRFEDAIKTAEEAVALAEKNGPTPLVSKNRELLAVYREHRAWREPVRAQ